jgi:hypothetical protein
MKYLVVHPELERASRRWCGLTMTPKALRLLQDLRRQLVHPLWSLKQKSLHLQAFPDSGGGIRTRDLRGMSPMQAFWNAVLRAI